MNNIKNTINQRLKVLRKSLNMSQTAFGEKLELSKHTIINYEKGEYSIPKSVLIAIEKIFGVNPDWLEKGEGEMFVKKQQETGMNLDFIERLKKDLADKDDSFFNSLSISKERLFDIIILGKEKLSRKEVIELARKLKQPVDKYLVLSGYIPKEFGEAFENKSIVGMFRSMSGGKVEDEEIDEFIDELSKFLKGYIAEKKEKAKKRTKKDESK